MTSTLELPAPGADGVTVVSQSGSWLGRLLGLPFLLGGLWFLWQIVSGVVEYWRADALGQLPAQIPGFLLVALFGALFGAPGALLVFGRKRVELDPGRGEVREATHYGFYTRRRRVPLAELDRVELSTRETRTRSGSQTRSSWHCHAELKGEGKDANVDVAFDEEEESMRAFGRALAERLGVPLVDRTGG